MFNYIDYISNKNDLLLKMDEVKKHFNQLCEFDIDVSTAIKKIDATIEDIKNDTFSIVLVGAFSDGKTSVVAGWLNEKLDNMKIDSDESSDEILKYNPTLLPKGCQIVDTPGLFGDKTRSDESGAKVVLSDLTKKYISEANVILYVVSAKNPIKDSHKACVKWILNDLNKLATTIFVINKMDEVADLTDEEEFEKKKKIKIDTLRKKILECGISQEDADKIKVVCVSSAPNDKGIEEWKNYRDEYLHRSRITYLEEATNEVITSSGKEALVIKTGCDVLNNELRNILSVISQQEKEIEEIIIPERKESLKRNKRDLESLMRRIRQSREDIKKDLTELNKSKRLKIRSASMETFEDVIEDEIGNVPEKQGAILSEEISSIYNKYAEECSGLVIDTRDKFQSEYEKQNSAINNLIKKGVDGASMGLKGVANVGAKSLRQAIFTGRDLLGKAGVAIKFKPWQAANMASFATKTLPAIGAAIDVISNVVDNVSTAECNRKFEEKKDEIRKSVDEIFIECNDQINNDQWFFENFAPDVKRFEEAIEFDEKEINKMEIMKNKYMEWKKRVNETELSV